MIFHSRVGVVTSRISPLAAPVSQIKSAGVTSRSQNTQGLPQTVTGLSISLAKAGANRTLRISFTPNSADPYFNIGQAYIKQGNGTPTLLASGNSPIIVTLPKNAAPAIVTLVSSGNWGATPFHASPGKAVSLA